MASPYSSFMRGSRDPYEEELERIRQQNQMMGVGGAEMAQSGMSNPYGIAPKDARALRDAPGQVAQAEREADRQRQVAEMMRGQAPKVIQGNSRIQAANPYNAIAQAAMGGLSGLAMGRARKADESADEQRKALAQATAAKDEAMYGREREDLMYDRTRQEGRDIADDEYRNANLGIQQERVGLEGERLDQSDYQFEQGRIDEKEAIERQERLDESMLKAKTDAQISILEKENELEKAIIDYERNGKADDLVSAGIDTAQADAIATLGSAGERKAATTAVVAASELSEAAQLAQQSMEAGVDWTGGGKGFAVATAEKIGGFLGEGGSREARNQAKEELYDETAKTVRGKIARAVAAFKRSEAGANLTSIERELGEDWDPSEARSEEEAIRRALALADYMNKTLGAYGVPAVNVWTPPAQTGNFQSEFDNAWNTSSGGAM